MKKNLTHIFLTKKILLHSVGILCILCVLTNSYSYAQTETKEVQDENQEITPETKEAQPETKEAQPETNEVQPEIKETQSETKELQDKNQETTPETKETLPETNEIQSEIKEVLPETKESGEIIDRIVAIVNSEIITEFELNQEFAARYPELKKELLYENEKAEIGRAHV